MREAWAYIDPGTGFVFGQGSSFLWGMILPILMLLLLPLKVFFKRIKKFFWFLFILVIILIIGMVIWEALMNKGVEKKRVVILGVDALDANIAQKLMDEGRMPNFSVLRDKGYFSPLKTTYPAESAVAWSSFATGLEPAEHGIFDFIMRDPQNYLPYLSLNEVSSFQGKPRVQIRRKGDTFWSILSKNKIPSYIYFCPNTFPPEEVRGEMISGMGVPDILGTMGKFTFYTTKVLSQEDKESRGRITQVGLSQDVIETELLGPKINLKEGVRETKIPFKITLNFAENTASLSLQGDQILLKKGVWSNWHKVYFKLGLFKKAYGMARFYLKSIAPDFELYVSPINFDPQRPLFPISYPDNYSRRLADKFGLFYTQGMPHDTWALTENRLDEKAFLEHTDILLAEKKKILMGELKNFREGLFFFYLDTLDPVQHMFWRYIDEKSPLYEPDSVYKDTIFNYYEEIDRTLGEILKIIDKDTTLIVISDHGFGPYRKSAHLNRWLLENGFLFLKEGKAESKEFFEDVDWEKTKAYAVGFGGIYINRRGREKYGIVDASEVEELAKQIREKLKQWHDPDTGEDVVKEVYIAEQVSNGLPSSDAPDILAGFNSGYRASWQTALGAVPGKIMEDNRKKWSGDHMVDSSLVPGVIYVNKKMALKEPGITDIARISLGLFGVSDLREGKQKNKNER